MGEFLNYEMVPAVQKCLLSMKCFTRLLLSCLVFCCAIHRFAIAAGVIQLRDALLFYLRLDGNGTLFFHVSKRDQVCDAGEPLASFLKLIPLLPALLVGPHPSLNSAFNYTPVQIIGYQFPNFCPETDITTLQSTQNHF